MTTANTNSSSNSVGATDEPIAYRKRIREYYLALGYEHPYEWAHFDDVPFTRLCKPLADCTVALVTTAAPYKPDAGEQGPGAPYNGAAKFYTVYEFDVHSAPDLRISHIAYDRDHTAAEDSGTWLPIDQLISADEEGVVGSFLSTGFGLPTNRSQRTTINVDCPELLERLRSHAVDAVVLVPNCPVCHQSVSLAARHLEAAGIATVVMGCARDIVEYVGVPRLLFSDFPLGNAAGKPNDKKSQRQTMRLALELLGDATCARTTVQSPQKFSSDNSWKQSYSNASLLSDEEISRRRAEFDRQKQAAKKVSNRKG